MHNHADHILKEARLRRTRGRLLALEILLEAKQPMSHDEIEDSMPEGAMDRVSLYRALDAFVRAGIVHRVRSDDRRGRFEAAHRCDMIQCHPHFTCKQCGATNCMYRAVVPLVKGLPAGFSVDRQEVYLEGICADCSKMR